MQFINKVYEACFMHLFAFILYSIDFFSYYRNYNLIVSNRHALLPRTYTLRHYDCNLRAIT